MGGPGAGRDSQEGSAWVLVGHGLPDLQCELRPGPYHVGPWTVYWFAAKKAATQKPEPSLNRQAPS